MASVRRNLLRVDLGSGIVAEESLDPEVARDYVGGAGVATRLLCDEVAPDTNALGPRNKLFFMAGPLAGTGFPASATFSVATRSPLTGLLVCDSVAGHWGAALRRSGHDGIIIEGASASPVYLDVNDADVRLRDASGLWGSDALSTERGIAAETGDASTRVMGIGPAGERAGPLACLAGDGGRAVGRGGVGAVMGSKGLKAIAVRGTGTAGVADASVLQDVSRRLGRLFSGNRRMTLLTKWGTASEMDTAWQRGSVPARNWRVGIWKEGSIALGGKRLADTVLREHESCLDCPVHCTRWARVGAGDYRMDGPGPEYEAVAALGSLCLNDNLESVCMANDLCKRAGLDAVSVGAAVAFAMEAYERGLLTAGDLGGVALTWGNADAVIELVGAIADGRGLGRLLGGGTQSASRRLGDGAADFAINVKGMELPMRDPRAYFSLGVAYATGPDPVCDLAGASTTFEQFSAMPEAGLLHRQGRFDPHGKGLAAKVAQDVVAALTSMGVCVHPGLLMAPLHMAEALTPATGFDYTSKEVLAAGERVFNLQRMYNARCDGRATDDRLPQRLLEPLAEGGAAGRVPDLAGHLEEYRRVRGWTADGVPSAETLGRLGIG